MAVIKSGATTDQLTVDPTSKAARTTLYDSSGAEITTVPIAGTVFAKESDFQTLIGVHYFNSGPITVLATANASDDGSFWLVNRSDSARVARIKSIQFSSQLGSVLATPTSPRITVERVTFTGTATGATIAPAKRKSGDSTTLTTLRTASTGLSLTAGNVICSFFPVANNTAIGQSPACSQTWEPNVEDRIELAPGEGIVVRQAEDGTTADTRVFMMNIILEEFSA